MVHIAEEIVSEYPRSNPSTGALLRCFQLVAPLFGEKVFRFTGEYEAENTVAAIRFPALDRAANRAVASKAACLLRRRRRCAAFPLVLNRVAAKRPGPAGDRPGLCRPRRGHFRTRGPSGVGCPYAQRLADREPWPQGDAAFRGRVSALSGAFVSSLGGNAVLQMWARLPPYPQTG